MFIHCCPPPPIVCFVVVVVVVVVVIVVVCVGVSSVLFCGVILGVNHTGHNTYILA